MTDRMDENLEREASSRKRSGVRRGGTFGRMIKAILILAVVLGAVAFAAFRDLNNFDSIRRLFSYNKVSQDEQGKSEQYTFDTDRSNVYALLGDRLVIASTTGVTMLDSGDKLICQESVRMNSPAIAVGGSTVAVYDVGGTSAYVFGSSGLVRDMSGETNDGILALSLNSSDYMALTTEKSGCKSSVSVYNPSGECLFTFNSSDHYVMDASVLRDCKHIAAVTLGEAQGAFSSTVTLYSLTSEEPVFVNTLNSSLVLDVDSLGNRLICVADDRLTAFDISGTLEGSYHYDYPYLRAKDMGGTDFATLLLSRYRSGNTLQLVTVSSKGEVLGTQELSGEVLSISASGKYVAVLQSDKLTVYTSDLTPYAELSDTDYAHSVLMRSDGTVLMIGSSAAWLYIP